MGRQMQYSCTYCKEPIDLDKEFRYVYNRRSYHKDCLINKLKKQQKPKLTPDEITQIVKESKRKKENTTKSKTTAVKVPILNKKEYEQKHKDRNKLIEYVESKYRFLFSFERAPNLAIDAMDKGTYKTLNGVKVPYELIYDMLCYYSTQLDYAHSKLRTDIVGANLFLYDLSILLSKVQEFGYIKAQQNQKTVVLESDNVDVLNYTKNRIVDDKVDDMDSVEFWDDFE